MIEVGDLLGLVGDTEVRSAFAGTLEGVLVLAGERVSRGQPVAWLRAPIQSDRSIRDERRIREERTVQDERPFQDERTA
jgi:pyruvate/2-oxoglutarate dehydrogenase complex dihydrolipoamide acyltransferase (E2) component